MNTTVAPWDVDLVESVVPDQSEELDAAFEEILAPQMSSEWVCTLTIECGTLVCACR